MKHKKITWKNAEFCVESGGLYVYSHQCVYKRAKVQLLSVGLSLQYCSANEYKLTNSVEPEVLALQLKNYTKQSE